MHPHLKCFFKNQYCPMRHMVKFCTLHMMTFFFYSLIHAITYLLRTSLLLPQNRILLREREDASQTEVKASGAQRSITFLQISSGKSSGKSQSSSLLLE